LTGAAAPTLRTPYGEDAAAINMVVVNAAMRGRGLGRNLMEEALARAGDRTCLLMATQQGLPLYEMLNFVAASKIAQHQGMVLPVDMPDQVSGPAPSSVEYDVEGQMAFHQRGLQHDEAEVFVDANVHFEQTFHDRLVFVNSRCDKLHQIVVAA
jgi:hypothetical protein